MDYALVAAVERCAGAACHKAAQTLAIYSSAHQLLQAGESRPDLGDIAQRAERELRAFVRQQHSMIYETPR